MSQTAIASAQPDAGVLVIENAQSKVNLNKHLTVYQQKSEPMDIELFRSNMSYLPNKTGENVHFGHAKNGLWFTANILNASQETAWVLSINHSQLSVADVFLYDGDKLLASNADGNLNKTSAHSTPTFRLVLPQNKTLTLYVYAASSTLNVIAPMSLSTSEEHIRNSQYMTLLWGLYYGALLIFFIFAVFFTYKHPSIISIIYFAHLHFVFCGLLLLSGHINFLINYYPSLNSVIRSEILSLAVFITSTLITALIIPVEKTKTHLLLATYSLVPISFISAVIFLSFNIDTTLRYGVTAIIGVSCVALCLGMAILAFRLGFLASKAIITSWCVSAITTLYAILCALQYLPSIGDNSQVYAFSFVLQTGAFMYAMVSKKQRELEEDVVIARMDAENNYLRIEEQNVHLTLARQEAVKASDVKSQFLANMSHEIRTPLNAIIGFSKELELHKNSSEREEHVKIINSAASDLLDLVNDLLDFSKMEAGLLTLSERPFSPRDLFEDVAATMSKTAHLKELEFLYFVEKLPDSVIGDALKVKQLLSNLLSNALKFTNYGHVGLRVSARTMSSLQVVLEITVFDSGIGISEEDIEDIFKAFHQVDDDLNRSFQGSGLGLVICQELVRMMQGKIEVTSQPSVGTEFKVTIPFVSDRKMKSDTETEKPPPAVVYDPWYLSRRYLAKQLCSANFSVSTYETLYIALENTTSNCTLFLSLPMKKTGIRADILNVISKIDVKNLVILYSGPTLPTQQFSFLKEVPYIIRSPLTERKLEQIQKPILEINTSFIEFDLSKMPPLRILAVDDMELNLRLVDAWLKDSPITLDLAYNAKTAIEKCELTEYDMILMDVQMPTMDGITAAKEIRKIELNQGTPIIAVTAHAMAHDQQKFLNNGMDDFLPKPIRRNRLLSIIHQWCDGADLPEDFALEETHDDEVTDSKTAIKHLESIDWTLSLQRNNDSAEYAIEYMDDFVTYLHTNLEELAKLKSPTNNKELLTVIHKMHGACCYIGVPKLQMLCASFQEEVKYAPKIDASTMVVSITREIRKIIKDWQKRKDQIIK